jgi:hypothetical protein
MCLRRSELADVGRRYWLKGKIEKATADQAQTKINRGRRNGEREIWLYGAKMREERGK